MKKLSTIGLVILTVLLLAIGVLGINLYKGLKVQSLCQNIRNGKNESVIAQLENYSSVNITPGTVILTLGKMGGFQNIYATPLNAACASSNSQMVEYLLSKGADPNFTAKGWEYPLESYCNYGYNPLSSKIGMLLAGGANPNFYEYTSPVFSLADKLQYMDNEYREKAISDILLLLDAGAEFAHPRNKYSDLTLFHLCAYHNDADLLKLLLGREKTLVYLEYTDSNGQTAYEAAAERGYTECAELLKAASEK